MTNMKDNLKYFKDPLGGGTYTAEVEQELTDNNGKVVYLIQTGCGYKIVPKIHELDEVGYTRLATISDMKIQIKELTDKLKLLVEDTYK